MDELEALRKENAEQRRQLAQILEQNAQLVKQLAHLNDRVGELLAAAQRKQRKARAPAALQPPVVEGEQQRAFEERPKAPEKPLVERTAKKKAKPTGRKPLPGHLEAEEHELRPESCAACGGSALDVADQLIEEKLHVVKEHQRRRKVHRKTCRCRKCGKRTTARNKPPG